MPVRGVRRRYLFFTLDSDAKPTENEVWDTVRNSIQNLYGVKGLSLIDPNLIEYDAENYKGIIRCTHNAEKYLRVGLAYTTSIGGKAAGIRVKRSSGTIKALREKTGIKKPKKRTE